MYKVAVYTNFPLTPTPGYMEFFRTIFSSGKFELVDVNNPMSADFAICFNHTKENLEKIVSSKIPVEKRVLIMLECKQILPVMHTAKVLKEYGTIFAPSQNWAKDFNKILFDYPFYLKSTLNNPPLKERQYKLGIIQRNKFSCIKGELYTLRREVIKNLGYDRIAVRGEGWNVPVFIQFFLYIKIVIHYLRIINRSNIRFFPRFLIKSNKFTPVLDKQNFLAQIQVAVVIENSADYVSEKIFDCFRAGTVPIYVGPSLVDFGIPLETAIQCEPNANSILTVVNNIDSFNLEEIVFHGQKFLKDSGRNWDESISMKRLAEKLIAEI